MVHVEMVLKSRFHGQLDGETCLQVFAGKPSGKANADADPATDSTDVVKDALPPSISVNGNPASVRSNGQVQTSQIDAPPPPPPPGPLLMRSRWRLVRLICWGAGVLAVMV